MTLILANRCTWLQVYIVLVYFMVYQTSKFCIALMYIQHRYMVYGEFHRHHYLVLYQISSDNASSNPLLHEVCNAYHKMRMLGIGSCYNTFHIFLCNISIILNMIMSIFPFSFHGYFFAFSLINDTVFAILFCRIFLELLR